MAKVLVVGQGGREHALVWKLSQSPKVSEVFCAPGNAGTAEDATNVDIAADDCERLAAFAKENEIDLTVVGPEVPLVAGISDHFKAQGLRIFGPSKAAAALEGSKIFCKEIMRRANVPTADYWIFTDATDAVQFVQEREEESFVIKADGLAAGKGVSVCSNKADAIEAIHQMLTQKVFGDAGKKIIIEEVLEGQEVSVLALVDGRTIVTLEPAQDHKAAYDGDEGPNTGGMGAYTPAPFATPELIDEVISKILIPTIHTMRKNGSEFKGVLYAGLMLTKQGPKVLEYNVRLGDPEAQPVLMRLKSDLYEVLFAAADGKLKDLPDLEWDDRSAICVVMASEGYPGPISKGHSIRGLDEAAKTPETKVFHAGTAIDGGNVTNTGGRVLGVTSLGNDLSEAKKRAYEAIKCIRWQGAWCRKDISDKARSSEPAPE
ncbi:phosphoribosylamine--glycine ligase [Thalassoglobus polymorphus]|uniref:Phosphoribosylamine--glycine ligase n=1 Tax=Thalassoglobus polymorphus TaxID=2527994 RepID=A0A517QHF4_9PLAN|nr:phosphoribosylamine--glycine ligase [Thalassoglobus polymorphus]QDT31050.1 Phosphoribosylamine--glycine ligase [Thalassoglobus polymorphus]